MAISFQSDEEVLRKLRDRLRKMTDEELGRFGKEVRRVAENVSHAVASRLNTEQTRKLAQSGNSARQQLVIFSGKFFGIFIWWSRWDRN
jgi:hypothetical protein